VCLESLGDDLKGVPSKLDILKQELYRTIPESDSRIFVEYSERVIAAFQTV
jgi:hypothetical protein